MRLTHRLARPCLGLVVILGVAGAGLTARSAPFDDGPTDADRAAIEVLGKEIVARLDSAAAAVDAFDEADLAALRAKSVLGEAEKSRIIAQISVKEYQDGSYPQDRQTILGEIALAQSELQRTKDRLDWSQKMFDQKRIQESQLLADRMAQQKSEVSRSNAKLKMDLLEKFTKVRQTKELEANVKKAEAEELRKNQEWRAADKALLAAVRRLKIEKLTMSETQAIVRLDEAISLFDEGKAEPARAELDAAKTLWRESQEARAKAGLKALTDRIKAEADKVRGRK